MRKLVYAINLTLDGVVDHTKGEPDEELHDFHTGLLRGAGVLLYGRTTYELMVPFWPDVARDGATQKRSMREFAEAFVAVPRIAVVSRRLEKPASANTEILRGDLRTQIVEMKRQPGGHILVGGVDLPSQLFALGLIDEAWFVVQPLLVGPGRRLMDQTVLTERLRLDLVESKTLSSGTIALHYRSR